MPSLLHFFLNRRNAFSNGSSGFTRTFVTQFQPPLIVSITLHSKALFRPSPRAFSPVLLQGEGEILAYAGQTVNFFIRLRHVQRQNVAQACRAERLRRRGVNVYSRYAAGLWNIGGGRMVCGDGGMRGYWRGWMSKLLRALVAGYGAKKSGCGCVGTIVIFLLLWWLLGHFGIFQ